jgi:Flp pilus assembly protein TadG
MYAGRELFPSICAAIYLLSPDDFTTCLAMRPEMTAETNPTVTAMFGSSICKRIRDSLALIGHNQRGNIAPIFAIALLPMLGFVGAAVDYTRANAARSSMQAAMDSAVLMVSKDAAANPAMTAQQITDAAQTYFSALYHDTDATGITIKAVYTPSSSSTSPTVQVTGSGIVTTDFMKVAGIPQINFSTSSTSTWGNSRMRVAMVLDNTGSMQDNGKMGALITAAQSMVTSLSAYNKNAGDVYISIVPFSKDVNVGTSYSSANWIKFSGSQSGDSWDENNGTCSAGSSYKTKSACTAKNACSISGYTSKNSCTSAGGCSDSDYSDQSSCVANGNCSKSQYTSSSTCTSHNGRWTLNTWTAPGVWSASTWTPNNHSTWNGCIMDRDQNNDESNIAPVPGDTSNPSTLFYAEQSTNCPPATVTPMSNQWSDLKTQIGSMSPNGSTNQAIGLAWGWQSLSTTNAPIPAPAKDANYIYQDYIVLLSDGLNTQNRFGGDGSNTDTDIDARQETLCQNIKNDHVTIFTIQVNISSKDPTSKVLQDCASNGNFQMITSANQTAGAFQNILTQISQLRIAK